MAAAQSLRLLKGVIWRRTLSVPLFRLVTYDQVRASPKKGRFRVLHPNDAFQWIGVGAGVYEHDVHLFGACLIPTCSSTLSHAVRPRYMVILYPLLPFGTPPPLGIEDCPPKMRDFLFHKGANCAFMKTPLEKGLSLALTQSSGDQYLPNVARGARRATRRAPSPCLLNFSSSLRGRRYAPRRSRGGTPPVNAWLSGA